MGVFTDIGTHPPKPPPLVELQRNPPGLRFFLCRRCGSATYYWKTVTNVVPSINRRPGPPNRAPYGAGTAGTRRCNGASAMSLLNPADRRGNARRCSASRHKCFGILDLQQYSRSHLPLARESCAEFIPDCNLYAASAELAFCAIASLLTAVKAGVAAAVIDLASLRNQGAFFNERISRGSEQ